MNIFLILIAILLIIFVIGRRIISNYYAGKAIEVWHENAIRFIIKKILLDVKDDNIAKAVIGYMLSFPRDFINEAMKELSESQRKSIKDKALKEVQSSPEFLEVVVQTLRMQINICRAHNDDERYQDTMDNEILREYSEKIKFITLKEYIDLVEEFARNHGFIE
jgi:hypothetical protein